MMSVETKEFCFLRNELVDFDSNVTVSHVVHSTCWRWKLDCCVCLLVRACGGCPGCFPGRFAKINRVRFWCFESKIKEDTVDRCFKRNALDSSIRFSNKGAWRLELISSCCEEVDRKMDDWSLSSKRSLCSCVFVMGRSSTRTSQEILQTPQRSFHCIPGSVGL